eukprot:COSAG05_NODE_69_length_22151_cov_124.775258_14_plen_300_part_00
MHVKLLCPFQVVVGSWLDLFRSVYCDQVAPSGGECRPRGVYRGLRSPAAFARPDLSVDPAVFTTAADARQLASSAGSRGERRPRGKHCGRRSPCSHICWPTRWREIRSISAISKYADRHRNLPGSRCFARPADFRCQFGNVKPPRLRAYTCIYQHVSPTTHSISHSAPTHVRGCFATLFALEGAPAAVFTAGSTLTPMEGASAAVFTAGSTLTPLEGALAAVFTAGSTLTPLEGAPAAVFTAGSCSPPRRGFFGLFATLETPDAGSLGASMGFSALRPRLVRPAGIVDVSKGRLHGLVW